MRSVQPAFDTAGTYFAVGSFFKPQFPDRGYDVVREDTPQLEDLEGRRRSKSDNQIAVIQAL